MKHLINFLKTCKKLNISISEKEIMVMIHKVDYKLPFCQEAFLFLSSEKYFLELLGIANKRSYTKLIDLILPYINCKGKSDDNLFAVAKQGEYHNTILDYIIPHLHLSQKIEPELLIVLKKMEYAWKICDKIFPLLDLPHKKELWLWKLVKASNFNRKVCINIIPYLSPAHALQAMKKHGNDAWLCRIGIKRLKKKQDIFDILQQVEYDTDACEEGLPLLKTEASKMEIMQISNYDVRVCKIIIPTLKQQGNKRFIIGIFYREYNFFQVLFPICTEKEIMDMLEQHKFPIEATKVSLSFLDDEDNMLTALEHVFYAEESVKSVIGKFNIKKKTIPERWELVEKTDYDKLFCSKIVPLQGLETNSDEEILMLLKERTYKEQLCIAVFPYLKDDAAKAKIYGSSHNDSVRTAVLPLLAQETIDDIFKNHYYDDTITKILVPLVSDSSLLLQRLQQVNYKEEFCEVVTASLLQRADKKKKA